MTGKPTESARAALAAVLAGTMTQADAAAHYGISTGHLRRMLRAAGAPDRRTHMGKGYRSTKHWTVEQIEPTQWRISVQGRDSDGAERCEQATRHTYEAAVQYAAEAARRLGLA